MQPTVTKRVITNIQKRATPRGKRDSKKGVKRRVTTKKSLHWVLYHNFFQMSIENNIDSDEL